MNKKILYIGNKLSEHGNTTTSIETLGSFLERENYILYYASSYKNKLLRMLDMIYSTIKFSRKCDYVLIDTYSTYNFWFALIVSQMCRVLKVKYIAKLHGGDLPKRLAKNPLFCDMIFYNAFKISAPSDYLLNAFYDRYSQNLEYIPNTIEVEKYTFSKRPFLIPRLFWVRSFSTIYNPKMAIKVLSDLKIQYPDAVLCMVGPDKENLIDDCKSYAKELNVEVKFTGKLSKEEWTALSKEYNVFINTTHFDNTPISVIEAMALGMPIISTNVGGIPFLINDKESGLLVNDNDSQAMIDAVKLIFNEEELRNKIIANARKKVEEFDWNVVKHKWFEILN
jgi:glycosyltransferase involved in cell wall biosynthesis